MAYTLGIGTASLIALPLLWQRQVDGRPSKTSRVNNGHHCTVQDNATSSETSGEEVTQVQAAYFVVALTGFLLAGIVLCLPPTRHFEATSDEGTFKESSQQTQEKTISKQYASWHWNSVCLCFMIFTAMFGGIEITFTGLMITYSYHFLAYRKQEAIIMSALYQFTKLVFSLLSMLLSTKIPEGVILCFNVIVVTGTSGYLLGTISCDGHISLWISTTLLAIGNSSLFPCCLTWMGQKHRLWRKLAKLFNLSFCTGVMILPYLTAHLLVTYGYKFLPWVLLACSSVGLLMSVFLFAVLELWPSHRTTDSSEEIQPLITYDQAVLAP